MADERWPEDDAPWESAAEFRRDRQTDLMAKSEVGEIWILRKHVAYFLPDTPHSLPQRLRPHAAVRPVIEGNWEVVDENLLEELVRQLERPAH